ncbi:MAG: hypothetical protein COX51_06695 [Syntrophobacteraceae bacterium CG23_combo_of_CG06-09_8_20_14_all_50_8]|nr:MAG: hypothetical protein COX51_06695 [Syntrophobacteraceae bacterium CG23_combo_of_CG06-09_8_20_14_all_50_8]
MSNQRLGFFESSFELPPPFLAGLSGALAELKLKPAKDSKPFMLQNEALYFHKTFDNSKHRKMGRSLNNKIL